MTTFNLQDGVFTTSDGMRIAFTRHGGEGEGPRIVLIHSLALDRSMWAGVVERLRGEAEILTYDCRGHGKSTRHPDIFTAEWFARDLAELLDHVGWRHALVAGCSMGGCVALAFAAQYPKRAARLCLIDTTAWYGPDGAVKFNERAVAAREKGMRGLAEFQMTRWFSDDFRAHQPDVVRRTLAVFVGNDIECYAASCELLGAVDLRSALPAIKVPAVIVVGEEDYATPIVMSQHLHQGLSDSTLLVMPRARHLTPIEHPDTIASHLRELLRRPPASTSAGAAAEGAA